MATNPAALSKLARLSMAALGVTGTGTIPLFFSSFSPGCGQDMINIGQNVGGFSNLGQAIELTRANTVTVAPRSSHKPSLEETREFLKSVFNNGSEIGGAYTYDPDSQYTKERSLIYDDTQTVYKIDGCVISRAVFAAQSRGELTLDLDWAGKTFTTGYTYPTLTDFDSCLGPHWLFVDGAVVVGGTTIKTRSIRITLDNGISNDRYFYGATSAGPVSTDRTCSLDLDIPYGLHPTLRSACNVNGGVAATATFSNGAKVLTFNFPAIRTNTVSVDASVPAEMYMPFSAQCFDIRTNGSEATGVSVTIADG